MEKKLAPTKAKKCDYCDEFAQYKLEEKGLPLYLCDWCLHHLDLAKAEIDHL
ncbi:hypothetical protein HZB00_02255 [Candidatus Woesearchaeota archaeon]|nr:hypothetical protein [Candidatus Woesearchaeota archaeon]